MTSDREWAERIAAAHVAGTVLDAPTGPDAITEQRAYAVQREMTRIRLERGQSVVGWKLGYTSTAMREQMGIDSPNLGPLTDAMILASPASLPGSVTQPRVEPEVALVVGSGPHGVAGAYAALEVVDSVWRDYRFTWADNTADGSSAAYVVLGPALPLDDLASVTVELAVDGTIVGRGTAAAAMGDPVVALDWLREQLVGHERGLQPGDVVITGGLTSAVPVKRGATVRGDFGGTVVEVTRAG